VCVVSRANSRARHGLRGQFTWPAAPARRAGPGSLGRFSVFAYHQVLLPVGPNCGALHFPKIGAKLHVTLEPGTRRFCVHIIFIFLTQTLWWHRSG
jgi:hypothetical protein